MFRFRDPNASLEGIIDPVVIIQVAVWALAGIWSMNQLRHRLTKRAKPIPISLPQKVGFGLVALLALSTLVSVAPSLTAFKSYQMLVSLLFTLIYVEKFGIRSILNSIFWSSTILCAAIAVSVFVAPDMVLFTTETGAPRLRGELIAPTAFVSLLALILLLTRTRRIWIPLFVTLLLLFGSLLILSLERTAYIAILGFAALAALRKPQSKAVRYFAHGLLAAVILFVLFGGMQYFDQLRNPQSIWTLSDRLGLWAYLTAVTLGKAPWTGLGFYAASRIYGQEYSPGLGTAHSMFLEAFIGAGIPALVCLLVLCSFLVFYAVRIYRRYKSKTSLAIVGLVLCLILEGSIGADISYGSAGITFWALVTILPLIRRRELLLRSGHPRLRVEEGLNPLPSQ